MIHTPIGIFPRTSETVLVSYPPTTKPYYLVAQGSREEAWIKKFIDSKFVVSYEIGKEHGYHSTQSSLTIMEHSNLLSLLEQRNIKHILVTIAKSEKRHQWAQNNQIQLIYTNYHQQMKYENKLWFDSFLDKHRLPKPKSFFYQYDTHRYNIPFTRKVVIQKSNSLGNTGTYILDDITEIDSLFEKGKLQKNENYLVRQFIEGITYGIELFISSSTIAISQARIQCFYQHESIPDLKWFSGTQFVPSDIFSPSIKKSLTATLTRLATLLHQDGYLGYAGIDLIITDQGDIFILECNPRFTTSSPLLMQFRETFSGINTSALFIEEFLTPKQYLENPLYFPYPESNFKGSIVRLLLRPHAKEEKVEIKHELPLGLYALQNGTIKYQGPDTRALNNYEQAFSYYCDLKAGETYKRNLYSADIYANFPLYNHSGKINSEGRLLINYFGL